MIGGGGGLKISIFLSFGGSGDWKKSIFYGSRRQRVKFFGNFFKNFLSF